MNNTPTMQAQDAVYGSLATCYVTLDGQRYVLMSMTDWESKLSFNSQDVKILGRVSLGTKTAGYKGSWSATLHYNTSIFRKWVLNYKKTGILQPFDVQVTNEDPSTSVGRQTITHTGCIPEEIILSKFVAGDELLDEEISGTFDDWDMPEEFGKLQGM